jgi:hypothetical protein
MCCCAAPTAPEPRDQAENRRLLQRRREGRDRRHHCAFHLRGAARILRMKGVDALILKYLHKDAPEADLARGAIWSSAATTPKTKSPSPSWASMWSTRTVTSRSKRHSRTARWRRTSNSKITWIEAEGLESNPDSRRPQLRVAVGRLTTASWFPAASASAASRAC